MGKYYSPNGNPEIWNIKPESYYTEDEWNELNELNKPEPLTLEEQIEQAYNF